MLVVMKILAIITSWAMLAMLPLPAFFVVPLGLLITAGFISI